MKSAQAVADYGKHSVDHVLGWWWDDMLHDWPEPPEMDEESE